MQHMASAERAAVRVAAAHGIATEPVVLAGGYNLVLRLDPAPVVARVVVVPAELRSNVDELVARELAVTSYLAERGVAVVRPSAEVPPGPHHGDGFWMSFWEALPEIADVLPPPGELGRRLRELHEVLRDFPLATPSLDVPIGDVEAFLRSRHATADDRELGRALERIRPALAGPSRPVHGDAHPRNLVLSGGEWVWTDFEECCSGPVEWDLAVLRGTAGLDGAEALRAYGRDDVGLEPFRLLRELQGTAMIRTRAAVEGA